jgi:hypothetical protein
MPTQRPADPSPGRAPGSSLSRARGDTTRSAPATPDHGENSASTIVEQPLRGRRHRLDAHDFPDGGGSGGAEAFRRDRRR